MPELLIGCGNRREKHIALQDNPLGEDGRPVWRGLVTLDHDPDCKPDVLHDLEDFPYPFEDNSFDEIAAYHCLEHMGRQGDWRFFFDQFSELWRITKHGGVLFGIVPHINSKWLWGDPSHTRVISQESLTFLDQRSYWAVGQTTMSDFRHYYKASWEMGKCEVQGEEFLFALRCNKDPIPVPVIVASGDLIAEQTKEGAVNG
jgi:hypothetical protein